MAATALAQPFDDAGSIPVLSRNAVVATGDVPSSTAGGGFASTRAVAGAGAGGRGGLHNRRLLLGGFVGLSKAFHSRLHVFGRAHV